MDKVSPRFLAERSYLYFKYDTGNSSDSREFYLPMLENIEITESQKPNLAIYDILGRPGNVYAYLGAKSREFNLKFKITLPHVHQYITTIGLNPLFYSGFRYFQDTRSATKNRMKKDPKYPSDSPSKINYFKKAEDTFSTNYQENFSDLRTAGLYLNSVFKINPEFANVRPFTRENNKTYIDSVNLLILWLNVIRTSVVGNAQNTSLGPPVVYINHGTMYNNIPCVCTNYNIRVNNVAGYELLSLTPRQIEISLNLSENRTGSFEKFVPFKLVEGEAVAGWEAVMSYGTIDPYDPSQGEQVAAPYVTAPVITSNTNFSLPQNLPIIKVEPEEKPWTSNEVLIEAGIRQRGEYYGNN